MDAIMTVGSPCGGKGLCQYVTEPIVRPDPDVTLMSAAARPAVDAPSVQVPSSLREADGAD